MGNITQVKPAKERFPHLFQITDSVIEDAVSFTHDMGITPSTTALWRIKFCSGIHALNVYRSINSLLQSDHWEDAGILTRGLFELALNLEDILRDEAKAEEKAQRFLSFGLLQKYLHARALNQYYLDTGRGTKELENKIRGMDKFAESHLKMFRYIDKKGRKRWRDHWSNKSVRDLAVASVNPMHAHHYTLLYSFLSTFTHSSPMAVMGTFTFKRPDEDWKQFDREHLAREEEHVTMVMQFSTHFFLEILLFVGDVLPKFDPIWGLGVLNKLYEIYGVKPPLTSEEFKEAQAVFSEQDETKKEEMRQVLREKGFLI